MKTWMKDTMSKIHLELLDEKRKEVLHILKSFNGYGFLTGGTALALQINHRKSVDFDIFVSKEINNHLRKKAKDVFGSTQIHVDNGDQLTFSTPDHIEITFLWYYYKALKPTIKTSSISLSSVADILADKAHTIGRRAVWRDYVDIFYVIHEKITTLPNIVISAERKFGSDFSSVLFLQQLAYFDDFEASPVDFTNKDYSPDYIKKFLSDETEKYTLNALK